MKDFISEVKDLWDSAERKWAKLDNRIQFGLVFIAGIVLGGLLF